jgi:hypothetical protein
LEEALAVEHAEVAEVERVGAMSCYTHRPRAVPQERTTMKLGQLAVVVLMMVFLLAGCGGGKPVVIENREVFDAAVEQYLRSKSMELVISEYISFEMDEPGAAATAVIALKHAGPSRRDTSSALRRSTTAGRSPQRARRDRHASRKRRRALSAFGSR